MTSEENLKQLYYSVIQLVPDPGRGEFINIGVIVVNNDSCFVQWDEPLERVKNWGGLQLLEAAQRAMNEFDRYLLSQSVRVKINKSWLEDKHQRNQNMLQFTQPQVLGPVPLEYGAGIVYNRFVG
jgi:hypothetical protein